MRRINSSGACTFFLSTARDINRKYADYEAVFIEEVGHYPMLERPEAFNQRQTRSSKNSPACRKRLVFCLREVKITL